MGTPLLRRVMLWCLVGYGVAAGMLLLSPRSPGSTISRIVGLLRRLGLHFVTFTNFEFGTNILLFIPFGLLLGLLLPRVWVGVGVAILLSVTVELIQGTLPERVPSLWDVVANSTGAVLGGLLALAVGRFLDSAGETRRSAAASRPE